MKLVTSLIDKPNPSSPKSRSPNETYQLIQSQVDNKLTPNHFKRDKPTRNFVNDNIKKITKTTPQIL